MERQLSGNTIAAYRLDLARLVAFASESAMTGWQSLNPEQLRALVAREHRRGLGGKSLARWLAAVRSFCRWLLREGRIDANPAAGLRAPKSGRRLPADWGQRLGYDHFHWQLEPLRPEPGEAFRLHSRASQIQPLVIRGALPFLDRDADLLTQRGRRRSEADGGFWLLLHGSDDRDPGKAHGEEVRVPVFFGKLDALPVAGQGALIVTGLPSKITK